MLKLLSKKASIASQIATELRSSTIQKDPAKFRSNMKKMGMLIAYEISKTLEYEKQEVETPLGIAKERALQTTIVLGSILRAGLPFHDGMLSIFEHAENAFIGAYRSNHKDGTFEIAMEYITSPDLNDKTLILCDPLLATGASIRETLEALLEKGTPKRIIIAGVIGSKYGVEYIQRVYPDVDIFLYHIDEELTAKSYIVPGLGDAGDLSYGSKEH